MSRVIVAAACAALLACAGGDTGSREESVGASLAPSGVLKAGINHGNPLLAHRDPATGELSGVAVDMSRELGRRAGVPVELVPFEAAGKMSAVVADGAWDIAFLAVDPTRAAEIDFSAPYLEVEGTYMVRDSSPLQTTDDVDAAGVRIVVTRGSAYDLFLTRNLKQAQLVRDAASTPESIALFLGGQFDAIAAIRTALETAATENQGFRVMPGRFMTIPQAVGVPKGRDRATSYVREFVESAKASGFVAEALGRHGLAREAVVAPPASN